MTKFQPGDEVFGKFQGIETTGTVVSADDMTGTLDAPQSYLIVADGIEVTGYDGQMTLVRSAS